MGNNERKDKVIYSLWLTEQEEKLLLESFEKVSSVSWAIIKQAHERGDFEKR